MPKQESVSETGVDPTGSSPASPEGVLDKIKSLLGISPSTEPTSANSDSSLGKPNSLSGIFSPKVIPDDGTYKPDASFADLLPWVEYLPHCQQFLFEDGVSRMSVFTLDPIPTEGRSQDSLSDIQRKLSSVLSSVFPEHDKDPWIVQFFLNSEGVFDEHLTAVNSSADHQGSDSLYTRSYLEDYEKHLISASEGAGYFHDQVGTDSDWRARTLKFRIVIYRRYYRTKPKLNTEQEMLEITRSFMSAMSDAGIQLTPCTGADFYRWMLIWFNSTPPVYDGDLAETLKNCPYPGDDDSVKSNDLAEMMLLDNPLANKEKGFWSFNGIPHTVVQVAKIIKPPIHGAFSGETDTQGTLYSLIDRLPHGSIISMTIFIVSQDSIKNRINLIADRLVGDTAESNITRKEASSLLKDQSQTDKLFPFEASVYIQSSTEDDLLTKSQTVKSQIESLGLRTVTVANDPNALDYYIKNLPGVQIESSDRAKRQRARLAFSSNVASLAPIYGRTRSAGAPGSLFFNRSGEPITFDPFSGTHNNHLLVLGPEGSGKTSTLIHMLMSNIAINDPVVYIFDGSNHYDLFSDHATSMGKSVQRLSITPDTRTSIGPPADLSIIDSSAIVDNEDQESLMTPLVSLLNEINDQIKKNSASGRKSILVIDHLRLAFNDSTLMPAFMSYLEQGPEHGASLWLSLPEISHLGACIPTSIDPIQWLLFMPTSDECIERIMEYKSLTEEQQSVVRSSRMLPGKYIESTLISRDHISLIRHVPSPLSLALCLNDDDSKQNRLQFMSEHNVSELEAALSLL